MTPLWAPTRCQRPAPGWRCSRPPLHPDACHVRPGPMSRLVYALHALRRSP